MILTSQKDTAHELGVSGGNVEAKRSNPVLKVAFIEDLHNRGVCWLSFAIDDRGSKQLANSFSRNNNRKTIRNFSLRSSVLASTSHPSGQSGEPLEKTLCFRWLLFYDVSSDVGGLY